MVEPTTPPADSVPDLISGIARRSPAATALSDGCRTLNYQALDSNASKFAGHLQQLGVTPGDAVVLCMERSFEWVTAALGILKAGAAYVPLDSAWPDARLRLAIADSGAGIVVGSADRLERLGIETRAVDPVRDAGAIAAAPAALASPIPQESLAYIVYTSGSTGTPKGVEITHANLIHLVRWHNHAIGVTAQDRASHLAGLGFDASVWEIWPHLCAGAALCLAGDSIRFSAETIQRWMIAERITVGFVPTVYAAPMMAMEWPRTSSLRFLLTGGDALRENPGASLPFRVVNNYGPAECTVVATSQVLDPAAEGLPPIGRAIAGAQVYLLDEDREPVPDGAVGEIYVGGNGVGRGYRNLPQATAQAFLPDPFTGAPGARMYRTGDRGLRRPDGAIEFRGRLDRQVKIRGQRVELDEIGAALARHPEIEFGLATANTSPDGNDRLLAYILPTDPSNVPTAKVLRAYLQQSLPDYMVPATFIALKTLPVSRNGKIDLNLLPSPGDQPSTGEESPRAASETEARLLGIVRDLLGGQSISARDNLFLSGGHSLFGMQLLTRVRTAFGVDFTLQQLFESPTVESLATLIEARSLVTAAPVRDAAASATECARPCDSLPAFAGNGTAHTLRQPGPAVRGSERSRFAPIAMELPALEPVKPAEERLKGVLAQSSGVLALHPSGTRPRIFWAHNLVIGLARELGNDQPLVIVTLTADDLKLLGERPSLESIARCFLRKIVAVQPRGPFILGGVCIGSVLVYELARQMRAAGHEVKLLILLDAPTQPYLRTCTSLGSKLRHPADTFRRMVRIGPWKTVVNLGMRVLKYFPVSLRLKFSEQTWTTAHGLIELAAFAYDPPSYDGDVLLLLSAGRVAYLDFLPGWQAVVRGNLRIAYVDARHRNFVTPRNVGHIARIVSAELSSAASQKPDLSALASSA